MLSTLGAPEILSTQKNDGISSLTCDFLGEWKSGLYSYLCVVCVYICSRAPTHASVRKRLENVNVCERD